MSCATGRVVEVVGAGPAGLAAAIGLARAGVRVRVLEKKKYPCVKLCGEFLSPEGLDAISRLSGRTQAQLAEALQLRPVRNFAWVSRRGATLDLALSPHGWAVRRDVLDPWLAQVAADTGAEVVFGTSVSDASAEPDTRRLWATGKEHDGLKSPYFAVKGYCRFTVTSADTALFQLQGGYIGFTRMHGGELSYCALLDRRRVAPEWKFGDWTDLQRGVFSSNPALLEWASGVASAGPDRHVGAARFDFRTRGPVQRGRWFAGDAAQLLPPFVGDGMALALESGELAARAIRDGWSDAAYRFSWYRAFSPRICWARMLHPMLLAERGHELALGLLRGRPVAWIYAATRGSG